MKKINTHSILFFSLANLTINSHAAMLTLDNYLQEVGSKNENVIASKLSADAAEERKDEHTLIFKPQFVAETQYAMDKKYTSNTSSQGNRTDYTSLKAGVLQQFDFGLKGQLSYKLSHTELYGTSSSFVPVPNYKDNAVQLELNQSLWRNFNGLESKSQATLQEASANAQKYSESYKTKVTLTNAQNIYWSLSQMQKLIKVQKESLERAIQIRNWAKRRLDNQLADKSDFLQADAGVKFRELEIEGTLQDEKVLKRALNSLRGINSDELDDSLEVLTVEKIQSLQIPTREEIREDVKASIEQKKIAEANSQLAIERNKPTFEIFGSYALNGRDQSNYAEATTDALKNEHETTAIGLKFQAPIDFFTTNKNISAYKQEVLASEHNLKRKIFDQDQQWSELSKKFEDSKYKLKLAMQIEEAQKQKAANERNRLNLGRTLTSTVLTFEQDLANSQLVRIKNETDIINTYSQLLTFKVGGI